VSRLKENRARQAWYALNRTFWAYAKKMGHGDGERGNMDDELLRAAKHEVLHALLHMQCATIHVVSATEAYIELTFRLQPSALAKVHRENAYRAYRHVTLALAGSLAPSLVMGVPLLGADLDLVEQWEEAWRRLAQEQTCISWNNLLVEARDHVRLWYRSPGMAQHVDKVAKEVARQRIIYSDLAWRRLVRACDPPTPPQPAPIKGDLFSPKRAIEQLERKMEVLYPWQGLLERYCEAKNAHR
jgi:hypothetical protein